MRNLFKTIYIPNADGSNSAVLATNANTVWVETYKGDNVTGNGTREFPYKNMTTAAVKANLSSTILHCVFRGIVNELFTFNKIFIGDDINQCVKLDTYNNSMFGPMFRCTCIGGYSNSFQNKYNIIFDIGGSLFFAQLKNSLCTKKMSGSWNSSGNILNNWPLDSCTINEYNLSPVVGHKQSYLNSIFIKSMNISSDGDVLITNTIFQSTCNFKYNGISIQQPAWGSNPKGNVELLRLAYMAAPFNMTRAVADATFVKDSFGNETCQIVHNEVRNGGTTSNIFAAYAPNASGILNAAISGARTTIALNTIVGTFPSTGDIFLKMADGTSDVFTYTSWVLNTGVITFTGASQTLRSHLINEACTYYGDVTDFSLNANSGNVALYASSTGGYVGALKPAIVVKEDGTSNPTDWGQQINVNSDGSDTGTNGNLLRKNADGTVDFNTSTDQVVSGLAWNRMRSGVIPIPNGIKFNGLQGMTTDGSPFGYYFGKHQNLVSASQIFGANDTYNPAPLIKVLAPNTLYKVCNDVSQGNEKMIAYCGNSYAPDFFFSTNPIGTVSVTSGSNVVAGTGTLFQSTFIIGSTIVVNGETMTVATITSNILMTVSTNFAATFSGLYTPPLVFTVTNLVDAVSNSYVKEILASPLESVEVLPYDTLTDVAVVLKPFSSPLFGLTYILQYTAAGVTRYGGAKVVGQQVTFAHLSETNFLADFPDTHLPVMELGIATTATSMNTITVKSDNSAYPAAGMLQIGSNQFQYTSKPTTTTFYSATGQTMVANAIGTLVNMVELKRDKIAYYDGYGISNADQEYVTLVNDKRGYFSVSVPVLQFLKLELNGHFNKAYDQ